MTREELCIAIAVELRDLAINASIDWDWGIDTPLVAEATGAIMAIIDAWDNGKRLPRLEGIRCAGGHRDS